MNPSSRLIKKGDLNESENIYRRQLEMKDEELLRIKQRMDEVIERHYREMRVIMGVVVRFGVKTISEHIREKQLKEPTSWLKLQRISIGQPVVSFILYL